jgi:RimJ/RimL family protein N-acetyltransferase
MKSFLTARLLLRGWRPSDAAPLAAMNADPQVMRYIGSGPRSPETALAEAKDFIASEPDEAQGLWAIEGRETGAFHGWVALMPLEGGPEIEIGYRLPQASWGRGIASAAAARLLAFGFQERGLERIVAVTHPENHASQRVLKKLGLVYHDTRKAYGVPGCFYYRLEHVPTGPNPL